MKRLDLSGQVVEFSQTTRTAADAAAAIGCEVGQIVKSLIFRVAPDGDAVLAFTSGANRVDEAKLRAAVGGELAKADADFVRQVTGYAIGGVAPFGYAHPAHTYIDEALFQYDQIWAAAGTPNAVFPLTAVELQQHTGGRRLQVA
ncbi:MAG: YbaK/EbsC family protein [Anaerolineales bacterium]|nr:YbaK/EbsC family protein [Anaerolineales bacterium]MCW5856145.1 YbaK/EbsC family protein [Anaerolineales bacterium]